jgi:Rieske Fe-S protein
MKQFTRRSFIKFMGAAAGVATLMPLRSLFAQSDENWVSVGSLEDFEVGKPELVKKGLPKPVIIYRSEDSIRAISPKCTHRGCTVAVKKKNTYACPCHGAQFDYTGAVTRGPATRDLELYDIEVSDSGDVMVAM